MISPHQLHSIAHRAFWGYFLILFNFQFTFGDLFALQFLPNSLGWWMLAGVAEAGAVFRPSLGLLRSFCLGLAVWNLTQFFPWMDAWLPRAVSLLVTLVILYTHFQFFTDLAALADEALPDSGRGHALRVARTVIVVVSILFSWTDLMLAWVPMTMAIAAAGLCAYIAVVWQLWKLYRETEPSLL